MSVTKKRQAVVACPLDDVLFELHKLLQISTGNHRFYEAPMDVHDDDLRLIGLYGLLKCDRKAFLCIHILCMDTETLSIFLEVHIIIKLACYIAFLVHDLLKLAYHTEARIVNND